MYTTINKDLPHLASDIQNFKDLSVSNFIRSYDNNLIFKYVDGVPLNQFDIVLPNVLWPIMLQMILKLKYIHDRGYAHKNITSENIILTPNYEICYINFGLTDLERHTDEYYLSPELFTDIEINLNISKAHDVWALVLVMKELVHNNYEYDDGRTNNFLNIIYVEDWKLRPTINMILNIFLTEVYSKIF